MNTEELENRLEEVLDEQFPKGKCKERGHALVLFAEAQTRINKLQKDYDDLYKIRIDDLKGLEKEQKEEFVKMIENELPILWNKYLRGNIGVFVWGKLSKELLTKIKEMGE